MIQGIKDCKFEPIDHTSAIIKIKIQLRLNNIEFQLKI